MAAPIDASWSDNDISDSSLNQTTYGQGTSFPSTWPTTRLFWRTDTNLLYKNSGSEGTPSWSVMSSGDALTYVTLSTTIGDYSSPTGATATSNGTVPGVTLATQSTSDTTRGITNGIFSRSGIKLGASSALIGNVLTKATFYLSKTGSPTGTLTCRIRDSGDAEVLVLGTKDVSTLTGSATATEFENLTGRTLASGDKILLEYTGGDASNYVDAQINTAGGYDTTNTFETRYNGSYTDATGQDFKFILFGNGTATAADTYDGSTSTYWLSTSEANPAIYWDFGSARDHVAFAINLRTTDTTVTQIKLRISTDTTFTDGETVRLINVSDFTNNTWRFILINRTSIDARYVQMYGIGTGVLAVYEFKSRYGLTDTVILRSHKHRTLQTTSVETGLDSN